MNALDIKWLPWGTTGMDAEHCRQAWRLASDWLFDVGIDLDRWIDNDEPAAFANPKVCTYAFQVTSCGGDYKAIVTVEIDQDPPARAVRVEVRRG